MEFSDVIIGRRSVRDFLDKDVEEEKLTQILETARLAPSWANKQCCKYIVIRDKAKIQELPLGFNIWMKKTPIIIAAYADPKESGSHDSMDYYLIDVGISMQQLVLAATNIGLGTCWVGAFDETKLKKTLEVPENMKVVALTPLGYAGDAGVRSKIVKTFSGAGKRKPLAEMIHREKW